MVKSSSCDGRPARGALCDFPLVVARVAAAGAWVDEFGVEFCPLLGCCGNAEAGALTAAQTKSTLIRRKGTSIRGKNEGAIVSCDAKNEN